MCSSTPYRWPIYSNDSIMEFSNREFSFMETSFPEIFCQGFFFHGKFFSWNFPFHEIKIFPGIFLIMENSFHGICFHSIFFLKFSFMEKKFMENSCSLAECPPGRLINSRTEILTKCLHRHNFELRPKNVWKTKPPYGAYHDSFFIVKNFLPHVGQG